MYVGMETRQLSGAVAPGGNEPPSLDKNRQIKQEAIVGAAPPLRNFVDPMICLE